MVSELTAIRRLLDDLDARLTKVEECLGLEPPSPKEAEAPVPGRAPSGQTSTSIKSPVIAPKPKVEPQGGKLLGAVGVLFFILAASFFIKLSIDSGWLTPERQLGGAFLFGALLIGAGFRLKSRDLPYSGLLPGAGVVVVFLSAYAGHLYYALYGDLAATLLCTAAAVIAFVLFRYFTHDLFLLVAAIGTYLVPALIGHAHLGPFNGVVYFLTWDLLFCGCAIYLGRRSLITLSGYLALGVFQIVSEQLLSGSARSSGVEGVLAFQAVQALLFTGAFAVYSIYQRRPLRGREAWGLFPLLLFFYAVEFWMLERIVSSWAPWASLLFGGVILGAYFYTKRVLKAERLASGPMIATLFGVIFFHSVYLRITPESFDPVLALLTVAFLLFAANEKYLARERFWPLHFVLYALVIYEYVQLLQIAPLGPSHLLYYNFCFAAFLLATFYGMGRSSNIRGWFLVLAKLQILVGLFRLANFMIAGEAARYLTSSLWGVYALVVLVVANQIRDKNLARSGVAVFGLVAVKVLFSDITSTGAVVRIISLIVLGSLLYAGGYILRRVNQWEEARENAPSVNTEHQ